MVSVHEIINAAALCRAPMSFYLKIEEFGYYIE